MVGGWPLFTKDALKWEPGTIKVVAIDALPAQLTYLESGHVQTLFAQNCYSWGYQSVEIILNKILRNEESKEIRIIDPLSAAETFISFGASKAGSSLRYALTLEFKARQISLA